MTQNTLRATPIYDQTPASNPFAAYPQFPGESDVDYQKRLYQMGADTNAIKGLSDTEAKNSQATLDQQDALRKSRLNDLSTLLAGQTDRQFNRDIPTIANTAQNAGMLETSGFGGALSRDYTNLKTDMANKVATQGLSDRDAYITGIGDIGSKTNSLAETGIQRGFSVADQDKSNNLALKLGQMGIPAPAQQPSTTDKLLGATGPILSGVGTVKGASSPATGVPNGNVWSSLGA